jgi:hypothetical protein
MPSGTSLSAREKTNHPSVCHNSINKHSHLKIFHLHSHLHHNYRTYATSWWAKHNAKGYITSYGNTNKPLATLTYNEDDTVSTILDRNGNTIFTWTYAEDGTSRTVEDYTGRKIVYETAKKGVWDDKLLITKVTGFTEGATGDEVVTTYEYDNSERIFITGLNPDGSKSTKTYENTELVHKVTVNFLFDVVAFP